MPSGAVGTGIGFRMMPDYAQGFPMPPPKIFLTVITIGIRRFENFFPFRAEEENARPPGGSGPDQPSGRAGIASRAILRKAFTTGSRSSRRQ